MMAEHQFVVLVFKSIHDVLQAEQILRNAGVTYELILKPTAIATDCGIVIKIESYKLCLPASIANSLPPFVAYKKEGDRWSKYRDFSTSG